MRDARAVGPDANDPWRYEEDIRRLARQLCRHREDAEDVAQTSLMKAAQHLDGFRAEASLRTWLHRIATNECRMLRRRTPPGSLDELLLRGGPEPVRGLELDRETADPEERALQAELRRVVIDALGRLPERHRTVLLLKDGRGLSAEEIARLTGSTVAGVRSALHRARVSVRGELADYLARAPSEPGPNSTILGGGPG